MFNSISAVFSKLPCFVYTPFPAARSVDALPATRTPHSV